jgi:hypothetical protein
MLECFQLKSHFYVEVREVVCCYPVLVFLHYLLDDDYYWVSGRLHFISYEIQVWDIIFNSQSLPYNAWVLNRMSLTHLFCSVTLYLPCIHLGSPSLGTKIVVYLLLTLFFFYNFNLFYIFFLFSISALC